MVRRPPGCSTLFVVDVCFYCRGFTAYLPYLFIYIWLLSISFWGPFCIDPVHPYINCIFHCLFLLFSLRSSWSIHRKISIVMNLASVRPDPTNLLAPEGGLTEVDDHREALWEWIQTCQEQLPLSCGCWALVYNTVQQRQSRTGPKGLLFAKHRDIGTKTPTYGAIFQLLGTAN